eukprot:2324177-Pleurochrysis_carterae.AAC.1
MPVLLALSSERVHNFGRDPGAGACTHARTQAHARAQIVQAHARALTPAHARKRTHVLAHTYWHARTSTHVLARTH